MRRLPARAALLAALRGAVLLCAVLPALLLAALGGCGAPDSGLRVEVRTLAPDGPPPREGLRLQHVQGGRATGKPLALRPLEAAGLYAVAEAPPGHYELLAPPGWGMLAGGMLPQLVPGASPAQYTLARQHTLVLVPDDARRVLGASWALEAPAAPAQPVSVGVEQDAGGAVLLRVPPAAWGGPVALQGRFEDGGLTAVWRGDLPASGAPLYLPLAPAEVRALDVVAEGALPAAGAWRVLLRAHGMPLPPALQAPLEAGRARLEGVPVEARELEAGLARADAAAAGGVATAPGVRLEAREWQGLLELRLLHPALQGEGARWVRLEGVAAQAGLRVQVAAGGAEGYGLASVEAAPGGALRLRLAPGTHDLLVQGPAGVQQARVEVQDGPGEQAVALPAPEAPAAVAGTVPAPAGTEVLWRRVEDGRLRPVQGARLRTAPGGRYAATLPPGLWQVEARTAAGEALPPRRITLTPGLQLTLSLQR
ncbi:MAG: hypothetical protein ACKOSS_02215 [Planctomycetia bacterium]